MPPESAEVRISPEAERDLESIWLYTLEEWGFEQANRYSDEMIDAMSKLANRPKSGVACDHIREGYRRSSYGRHAVYYRIESYGIAVVRILHDRMLPSNHL